MRALLDLPRRAEIAGLILARLRQEEVERLAQEDRLGPAGEAEEGGVDHRDEAGAVGRDQALGHVHRQMEGEVSLLPERLRPLDDLSLELGRVLRVAEGLIGEPEVAAGERRVGRGEEAALSVDADEHRLGSRGDQRDVERGGVAAADGGLDPLPVPLLVEVEER